MKHRPWTPSSGRPSWGRCFATLTLLGGLGLGTNALAKEPLAGSTHHYRFDGAQKRHLAWYGRAYLPPKSAQTKRALPLLVFLHGLNKARIKYRWMGGGHEGDVRAIVGKLVAKGAIEPIVVAGPSSIVASQVSRGASWNFLDLDNFIDRTILALKGKVQIDAKRIVVAGHSGAGCSLAGGLATSANSKRQLLGLLVIDTCMPPALAPRLLRAATVNTHVVVTYQRKSWASRAFKRFGKSFDAAQKKHPAAQGVLRKIVRQKPKRDPHNATVKLSLDQWLPPILQPSQKRASP
jgi:poly(3-hydroxybutyrate) depolymerase